MLTLRPTAIDGFSGSVVAPDDPAYEAARHIFNARFDPRPDLILRPADTADVAAAVRFARSAGHRLAVRSGGHSTAGHSCGDGAVLLDLIGLRSVDIDRATQTVWVGGGTLAGEVVRETFAHGLTVPFGDTASVGVAGITLGGGLGWLARRDGLTIDSLLAVEIVTADGQVRMASADEHPDLFWALRGGGGGFGVVTRLRFRLRPIGEVLFGTITLRTTPDVLRRLVPTLLAAPDELTAMPTIGRSEGDGAPGEQGELVVYLAVCWSGTPDAGERALAPIRGLDPVLDDTVRAMPYPSVYGEEDEPATDLEAPTDPQAPPDPEGESDKPGWAYRSIYLDGLADDVGATIARQLASSPGEVAIAHMRVLGGAVDRIPADATAYAWRDKPVLMIPIADDGEDPARTEAWIDGFRSELRARGGEGAYVNFLGTVDADGVGEAYPPSTLRRLRDIKHRLDPDDLIGGTYPLG